MDDQPAGLTPPGPERTPRAPERRPYRRHRPSHALPIVLGIVLGAAAIAIAVVVLRSSGDDASAGTTGQASTAVALPTLKVVFPEGFTREEMADRIGAVNRIAREERDLDTSLVPKEYLVETSRSPIPAEFGATKKRLPLEGFLFPATYEFTPRTTSTQLVDLQLAAFRRAWGQVDLDVRGGAEPDALRRAHHRLDDRGRGQGPEGAARSSPRSSTTGSRRACRSGSTRPSVTASISRPTSRSPRASSTAEPRTTRG